jgi:peroxiredoxin/protocatechuate 3,4-dioxygenase beta subunit
MFLAASFLGAAQFHAAAQSSPTPADAAAPGTNAMPGTMHFRVLDSASAAPVPGVKVRAWVRTGLTTDTNGDCSFALPKPTDGDFSYTITITKDGYVAKTINWNKARGDSVSDIPAEYTAKLEKAASIGGVLKSSDGQPLANAIIKFSGVNPAAADERERSLVAPNFHNERTDDNGQWQCAHIPQDFTNLTLRVVLPDYLPTTFGCTESVAGGEGVVRLAAADFLAGKAVMILRSGITLAGTIVDTRGKPVPDAVITRNHEWRNPAAVLNSDDAGTFKISNLLPGEMTLTIQAKGLEPQTLLVAIADKMDPVKIELKRGRILKGQIVDESGQPIAGATIQMDRATHEPLEFDWSVNTDANGRFLWDAAPAGEHPYLVTADGYNLRTEPALLADDAEKTITLRKANGKTDVDGTVTDATTHAPIDNYTVTIAITTADGTAKFDRDVSSITGNYLVEIAQKVTSFTLEFHRPGYLPYSTDPMSPGDGDQREDVQMEKGIPTTIAGQLNVPGYDQKINWQAGQNIALVATVPDPDIPNFDNDAAKQRWMAQFLKSPEGRAWQKAQRTYPIVPDRDGAFIVEDVPPGKYLLRIQLREAPELGGGKLAALSTNIVVKTDPDAAEVAAGGNDQPRLNLGVIRLQQMLALKVGDNAPLFATVTTDGKPLRLEDFRGKYVLLDFWATWCGPCVAEMPNLKATYDKHKTDGRFAMMSLSVDAKAEQPIDFAKKNDIHWIQGFLGEWQQSPVPDLYGVEGIPSIFLISPDGKIMAKNLRGPDIEAAVADALAPHGAN